MKVYVGLPNYANNLLRLGFSEDEIRGGANVVMLSEDIWRTRFGADSALVGSSLSVLDVGFSFQTDSNQVTAECLGDIE